MGKKIIEMKKIENRQALQVTFSKRRKGLFKKAAQLSALRRCPMLAIAFSPGGMPFSVGVGDNELIENFFSRNVDFANGVPGGVAYFGETQDIASSGNSALMDHDGDGNNDSDGEDLMNAVATKGEARSTDDAWVYQFDAYNCNSMEQLRRFIARAEEKQSNERRCSNHIPAAAMPQSAIEGHGSCFKVIDNVAVYDGGLLETGGETHAHVNTGFLGETTGLPENKVASPASIGDAGVVFQTYDSESGVSFDGVGLPECNGREADSPMMMQAADRPDPTPRAIDTGNAFFMGDMPSLIDWGAIDASMGGDHDLMSAVATAGEGGSTDGLRNWYGVSFDAFGVGLPEYDGREADSRMMMQTADASPRAVDARNAFSMGDMPSPIDWGAIDAPVGGDRDLMYAVATDGEGGSADGPSNENGVSFDGLGMPESSGREADSRMMIQTAGPSALAVDTRNAYFMEDMSSQIGGGAGVVATDTDDWLLDEEFLNRFMS